MTTKKFLRRDAARFLKFGKGRGKKAKWRSPKGRDNKMREKRRGYAAVVSIGHKNKREKEKIIFVSNVEDLSKIKKGETAHLRRVGKKKKYEIMVEAKKTGIKFDNINVEQYLKKNKPKEKKNETK